ncbi:MAG: glucan ABC transporter ATP-binding protein/ permease [Methylobacteriaceae bacterium]|nr:glucan ABC transporter ATP-binding protein/ permease [Methylobacteriaceae bacterium]
MSFLSLYARVLSLLGSEARAAFLVVAANLALAVAQFADPILFGRIVNQLATSQGAGRAPQWGEVLPLTAAWGGFGLFTVAAGVLIALNADRLSHRRRLAVMASYFEHVLHLPLSFHASSHSGRLMKVMLEGTNALASLWLPFLREHCASLVALTVMLPLSLLVNWRLALLLLGMVVLFGIMMIWVLRRTESLQGTVESYYSALAERASDALGNIPVIQSFTLVDAEARAMRDVMGRLLTAQMPVLSWWAVAAVATRAAATLTLISILITGIVLDINGLATVGEIVTFMAFATTLIARLEQIVAFVNVLFLQAPKLRDFFAVLDTVAGVRDRPGAVDMGRLGGHVVFENVSFSYDGRREAVSNVSFDAKPGDTIALVGATGSGKSTTLNLLHRVFDPTAGRVLVDGIDIRDMTLHSLRRNIGVVFQEPMLFARSLEENLRVGKADASAAEIALALERAQAADFVARQADGLRTIVGERGRSLSGGERQRIAIARALLKDPPIMIFDEATSALDATTERQIQAALEAATRDRTTFVIAHRLATIRNATRVLVFDQGRVVESGIFEELMARGGRFAALARAQFMADARPAERSPEAPEGALVAGVAETGGI